MDTLGKKIKNLRIQKGISKVDVARICGITQTAYANIENDITKSITIEIGKGIARALSMNFNELFNSEENEDRFTELNNRIGLLNEKIEELKSRISDKDLLISTISRQLKFLKYQVVAMTEFSYWAQYKNCEDQLDNCIDEKEREKILTEMSEIIEEEKACFADLVKNGTLEQNDVMENIEAMRNESKRPGYKGSLLKYNPLYLY